MTNSRQPSAKASAINFLTVFPVKVDASAAARDNERSSSEDRFAMLSPLLRQASSASIKAARQEGSERPAAKEEDGVGQQQHPGTT